MAKCPFCDHFNRTDATVCEKCKAPLSARVADTPAVEAPPKPPAPEPGTLDDNILSLMKGGKKIEAIKLYRARAGMDLKEAKQYVDSLAAKHGVNPAGGCGGAVLLILTLGAMTVAAACSMIH
jgi:hypothetical protein